MSCVSSFWTALTPTNTANRTASIPVASLPPPQRRHMAATRVGLSPSFSGRCGEGIGRYMNVRLGVHSVRLGWSKGAKRGGGSSRLSAFSVQRSIFDGLLEDEELLARMRKDPHVTVGDERADGKLSIVFASSEVAPWSKTGGLGDVCGALPCALANRGHRVMVVSPLYKDVGPFDQTGVHVDIDGKAVEYFHYYDRAVDWVFVHCEEFFAGREGFYGTAEGPHEDNLWRFRLLSLAALEAPIQLPLGGAVYGQDVVFVANDWQTALLPVYLATKYRPAGMLQASRCVTVIHNMRHQGVDCMSKFPYTGLPGMCHGVLEYIYPDSVGMNTLKGAVVTSDRIVTVSMSYAEEIQNEPGGWGLEAALQTRASKGCLSGVVNGINELEWDPSTDSFLPKKYGLSSFSLGKAACKTALQEEAGLNRNSDAPLISFIGRLDEQKGVDVFLEVIPWLMEEGCQVVCLGTGEAKLEEALNQLQERFPGSAAGLVKFDVGLSHRITAASDLLVMPSRFEPCGLQQQYAMRYATPVIAHATGGLKDTVVHYNPWADIGSGWKFTPCEPRPLRDALSTALYTMREHPDAFWGMKYRMIRQDFSWWRAAGDYEKIFQAAMRSPATSVELVAGPLEAVC